MPRANRYLISNQIYHITHRCHNRSYLLRFSQDRNAYRQYLREAAKVCKIVVLGYCITSNHIHILLFSKKAEKISRLMQIVEGSSAQRYNRRKNRRGAFWEDRFHCVLIDSGEYLWNCLAYIDLNMVRAGKVAKPEDWDWSSCREILGLRKRYRLVDIQQLMEKTGKKDIESLRNSYLTALRNFSIGAGGRDPKWTESVAIGGQDFVKSLEHKFQRIKLSISQEDFSGNSDTWIVREELSPYS